MKVYYNDNDAFCAQWLRNLIAAGFIPAGDVDERSILEVQPDDVRGYVHCHFFAGIGGWAYAARLAGWPEDRPLWTGSCPCQPLSLAGKQRGHADERHLWPAFHRLIAVCRPATVAGEQVAGKAGREWLAGVRADLEAAGYACGCADLCAAGVGAPHIRQRLFWLADAQGRRRHQGASDTEGGIERDEAPVVLQRPAGDGTAGALGDADAARSQGRGEHAGECADQGSPWTAGIFMPCLDGKARRVEPAVQPLAHGIPNRVGILRGAGNAIVPQVGAAFLRAVIAVTPA